MNKNSNLEWNGWDQHLVLFLNSEAARSSQGSTSSGLAWLDVVLPAKASGRNIGTCNFISVWYFKEMRWQMTLMSLMMLMMVILMVVLVCLFLRFCWHVLLPRPCFKNGAPGMQPKALKFPRAEHRCPIVVDISQVPAALRGWPMIFPVRSLETRGF